MKKLRRNLTSGLYLFVLLMIIEVLLIILAQFFIDNILQALGVAYAWLYVIWGIIRLVEIIFVVVLYHKILNRAEDPEFKIAWLIFLLIIPLFTAFIYIVFGNHGISKKEERVIELSRATYIPYLKAQHKANQDKKEDLGRGAGAFNYIKNTTGMDYHSHNHITYYKNGELFFPAFIDAIKEAKEFIFIEFFIITDGQEWNAVKDVLIEKAKQGVEVRIVYDDLGCSGTISPFTPRRLRKFGIKCYKFHKFKPFLHRSYNNRTHRKIVIVDHKYGFTGGINLADEYANITQRFGYWKDTMIRIEGSAISNLITTFLQDYDLCARTPSDYNKYLDYEYPNFEDEGYVDPFGDGPGGIDNALVGEQNYINILNYATKRVDISTPYLVCTYKLLDALRNAALRGVEVNLILPGIPDKKLVYKFAKSNFPFLLEAGVNIYLYTPGFNHMKSALADNELGFVGTINFDFRSLVHHFECGATLYKVPCLKEIHEDFEEMIKVSQKVPTDFRLSLWSRFICAILKLFFPLL